MVESEEEQRELQRKEEDVEEIEQDSPKRNFGVLSGNLLRKGEKKIKKYLLEFIIILNIKEEKKARELVIF